ncbi:MAG: amidohydrolase [Deltaproteobacteria bacterium]|nr:amidohydrolase [Deltaproteobacteria bacterium]
MKRIAVEEHFSTPDYISYIRSREDYPKTGTVKGKGKKDLDVVWFSPDFYMPTCAEFGKKLVDVAEIRLRDMEENGIDMQVLSLSVPGPDAFDAPTGAEIARKTNDVLYKIIKEYPEKFAGLAAVAPQDPAVAADELERAVNDLGMRGTKINSNIGGEYLDDKKYWVLLERAEKLGVPIYIHPKAPSPDILKPFLKYPALTGSMWGFSVDAGLHAMRLICSGVFDRYPGLKIILGHLGEAIPFWLWRIDNRWEEGEYALAPTTRDLMKKPSQYFNDNFYVTTSGNFWETAFMCTYAALGPDRIMFAVDYPFEPNKPAVEFMDAVPIPESDREKIYHSNAEKVFSL